VPLFISTVIVPVDERVAATSGAVVVLLRLLNSNVAPPLAPKVSVAGATGVP